MNSSRLVYLALMAMVMAMALLAPQPAVAQGAVTSASLYGDVYDKTGAVLPGAKVTVTAKDTGQQRETKSDQNGHFTVLQLPPGTYSVRVELTSFSASVIDPLALQIGEHRTIKVTLQLGEVAQSVQVTAEAVTVDTSSSEVANVIQTRQLRDLPLNQRSFTALVVQQPGLVQVTSTVKPTVLSAATNTGSMISADGSMGSSVAYLMDGVNFSNGSFTSPGTAAAGDTPGVEAIQEFKVLSHTYSAAYGGASAAVVSFATRTGTNNWHGSVYEYLRNDVFDASSYFDQTKPPFRRNQFGATLGGPLKKNKTFFFLNYEGLRQSLSSTDVAFVPTDCSRNGGFVGAGTGSCPGAPTIPGGDPPVDFALIRPILQLFPDPTDPLYAPGSIDLGDGRAQIFFVNKQPTSQDFGLVNLTHSINAKNNISVRYQIVNANAVRDFNLPNFTFTREDRNQNLLLKWNHTFHDNLITTLSFSYLRQNIFADTAPVTALASDQYTGNSARQTIGVISVGNGSAGTAGGALSLLGRDDAGPFRLVKNSFPINSDWLYVRGKHNLKFGGMVQRFQWNWQSAVIPGGSYTFPTLNDLLAGDPSVMLIRRDDATPNLHIRTTQIAWYVEDSWRMTPRLTLNIGLRHDFQVPILTSADGRLGNWASPTDTSVTTGEPYNNYSTTQFQPRVGLAWDVWGNGRTVVRAGWGLFNDFIDFAGNAQGQLQWNSPNPVLNTYFGRALLPSFPVLPIIPFPTCDGIPGFACTQAFPFFGLVTGVLTPVNSPTASQWSVEVQRELPGKMVLTLSYAGSQSYHIPRKQEQNYNIPCGGVESPDLDANGLPIFPYSGLNCAPLGTGAPGVAAVGFSLYSKRYDTNASYHGGTIKLARSFGDLSFASSYTFAKAISESDAFNSQNMISGVAQASIYPPDPRYDRSESAFSTRHRFTENVTYELPFGKSKKYGADASGVTQAIFGNWSLSSLGTVQSGQPFTVFAGFDITGMGDAIDFPQRPDLLSPNPVLGGVDQYFDVRAFGLPTEGHIGTSPRTPMRGPGFADVDFALSKDFPVTERVNLRFRADLFNILNHPNFGLPLSSIYLQAPQFGGAAGTPAQLAALPCLLTATQSMSYSCNSQAGRITSTVGVPRQIQLSLKLTF